MRPAIDYDLWLLGHTTADVSDPRHARGLADALRRLFDVDDLVVTWTPRGGQTRTAPWSEADVEAVYALGGINLSDPGGERFMATLDWNRVPPAERAGFLRNHGRRQNRLLLATDRDRVDRERYLDFARGQALALRVNLLHAYSPRVSDDRFGLAGLDAGLRDVYWLTVFGPAFVELIGAETLLSAPAETERLDGCVLVLAPEEALESREAVAPIRSHIGERHFVPAEAPKRGLLRRGGPAEAEARPSFDWSGVLSEG